MSAYAMPGSLFLPSPTAAATGRAAGTSSGGSAASFSRGPLHEQTVADDLKPADPSSVLGCNDGGIGGNGNGQSGGGNRCRDIIIAVKSASVDPVGLIQSIARGGGGGGSGAPRRQLRRRGDDGLPSDSGVKASSSTNLISSSSSSPSSPSSPSSSASSGRNSADDAIQFVLSINFNGRKYTATRTLPRLVELRNDLCREIRDRAHGVGLVPRRGAGAGLRRRRRHGTKRHDMEYDGRQDNASSSMMTYSDDSSSDTEGSDCDTEDMSRLDVVDVSQIPELPIGEHVAGSGDGYCRDVEVRGASFAGRGFTRLQAVLRSYCPAVESWLNNVADVVPPSTSPSLTKFLWEPLSANTREEQEDYAEHSEGRLLGDDDSAGGEGRLQCHARPPRTGTCSPRSASSGGGSKGFSLSSSLSHGSRNCLNSSRSVCTLDSINENEE